MMKLTKLLFLFIATTLILSSCSSDDKDDNSTSIVGAWTYSYNDSKSEAETSNATFTTILKEFILLENVDDTPYTLTFKSDNTYSVDYEGGDKETGTYSFKNGILTTTSKNNTKSMPAVMSGNTLTFNVDVKSDYVNQNGTLTDDTNYIFTHYASRLTGVNKSTLTISKANAIIMLKKK